MDTTVVIAIVVLAGLAALGLVLFGRRRKAAPPPVLTASSQDRTVVGLDVHARSDATVVDMRKASAPPAAPRSDVTMVGAAPAPAGRSDMTTVGTAPAPPSTPDAPTPTSAAEAPTVVVSPARQDVTAPTIRITRTNGRVTITKGGTGTYPIEDREYVIGRSNRADIIVQDPSVSGQHARLTVMPGGATVTDLGSSNGTTVNGAKVQGSHPVKAGDLIGVGDAVLRIELS